ncbi:MAG: FtsW/RodA/SpoVE family cell cycle protein [Candidatus Paceibacterota bacterium]
MIVLVLVLLPGVGTTVAGARRWIDVGFASFQPTEFAKFTFILYLSSWFRHKEKKRFFSFLLLLGFVISLVLIQPDLGTAVVIFTLFVLIYFMSGEPIANLAMLAPFAIGGFLLLVKTSPYRMKRLLSFLDPNVDPEGISYHIRQILISLSSGGLIGRGFSGSRQKYQFLPEAHTDSVFAIIAEETGFFGSVLIIIGYGLLMYTIYRVAKKTKDRFGFLLASSVLSLLSIQVLVNLGGMVNLMPLTGIPLPFLSYGGSSLLVFFSLMGIVINIARR